MLNAIAAMILSIVPVSALPEQDPSLVLPDAAQVATEVSRTFAIATNGEVLNADGILLTWNSVNNEYDLSLGGTPVSDLVTTIGSGVDSFQGMLTLPTPGVTGTVTHHSNSKWTVDISRPSYKPYRYSVEVDGNASAVTTRKVCECSDNIGLTCTTNDCNNSGSCSAGTATCKWKTVNAGS